MRWLMVPVLLLLLDTAAFAEDAKDAADHRAEGIKALRESQTDQKAIVTAAKHFGRAAAIYEKLGENDAAVEANSFLYWCKKKMTLADIEAFAKSGEIEVSKQLVKLDEVKVEKTDAQVWFDRAEKFAAANPDEHLLIAIRFFEVADRFKDSDPGRAAMDRSLKEMQLIASAPAKKAEPAQPATRPAVETPAKVPVPDAAKIKDAEKSIKDIFKEEYAKRGVDDKKALGAKLLQQGVETKDDPVSRYVLLKEAAANAVAGGDAETAVKALDALGQSYEVDTAALKAESLGKILPANTDAAKALARMYLTVIDEAVAVDSYDAAVKLVTAADAAARKAQDMPLVTQVTARGKEVRTLQADFAKVKTAQATLKDKPDDPEANLAVGKFLCFNKGDWEKGLPLLAKGSDSKLKELAEKDMALPTETESQVAIGDAWWSFAEGKNSAEKSSIVGRALTWYEQAHSKATGLTKTKIAARIAAGGGRRKTLRFSAFNYSRLTGAAKVKSFGKEVIDELTAVEGPTGFVISGTNKNAAIVHNGVRYSHNGKTILPNDPLKREDYQKLTYKLLPRTKQHPDGPKFSVVAFNQDTNSNGQEFFLDAIAVGKLSIISFAVNGTKLDVLFDGKSIGMFEIGETGRIGIAATTRFSGDFLDGTVTPSF